MTQVRIVNPNGEPRTTDVTIDGVSLARHVTAIRLTQEAGERPQVELVVRAPALDVLGDLAGVEVRHVEERRPTS